MNNFFSNKISGQQQPFQSNPEWFRAFLLRTPQKQIIREKIVEGLQTKFPSVYQNIINRETLRILYIGPGNGEVEISLTMALKEARDNVGSIIVYCIDPSSVLRLDFLKAAKDFHLEEIVKE